MTRMYNPELLLPVGNYQMCLSAIHNGANAIYVGMPEFNARGRSHDHSWDDLKEIIDTCHLYGVEVHLAFNILIFENEIEHAIQVLDKAVLLGPDALIVQDLGLVSLINKRYPDLIVHASTQMTVTNHEAIELLEDLNIQRFVLGRENTLDEIANIKSNTDKELEVFVHGALCVAYSGQCFTSESLGGRSANRGQCAQSCRFDYELYVDDKKKNLGINKYLVSPQDLCGINEVPKLMELGIDSFKVEGRLKSPEFVATVAKNYSNKIKDNAISQLDLEDMAISYSRGFYSGWLNGVAHQKLVEGSFKENRGALIGEVRKVNGNKITIDHTSELINGDGLLFVTESNNSVIETGGKIYSVNGDSVNLDPNINCDDIYEGSKVYITRRERIIKDTSQSVTNRDKQRKVPIDVKLEGRVGEVLRCTVSDKSNVIQLESEASLEQAAKRPIGTEMLLKGLGGLSHTAYKVDRFENLIEGDIYIHNSEIKKIKQRFVELLNNKRTLINSHSVQAISFNSESENIINDNPKFNVLVRKIDQLEALVEYFSHNSEFLQYLNYIILDYEFGKDYFPSVKLAKENKIQIAIATTRVLKPNEYHNFKLIDRCKPDAILVRNLGALNYFRNSNYVLLGDFSLNCANSYTHDYLKSKGLQSQCASYDLNYDQINGLIKKSEASKLEITIHQYMPEFHMEHCVFAAFMSEGNSFRDCGKPCEKHDVHLKDMYGNRHEIKADQECRNTMFNAKAQSTISYFQEWRNLGVGFFRFECLHEKPKDLVYKLDTYFKILSGEFSVNDGHTRLGKVESYGLSSGPVNKKSEYKSIKKFDA